MEPIQFILIIYLVIFITIIISLIFKYHEYYQSGYFQETKKSFFEVYFNKGTSGEYALYKPLSKLPGYKKFIFNVLIPKPDHQTTEIDLILLHETGIYVLENKNYGGWIFGKENQRYWCQTLKGRFGVEKYHFFNPIFQNRNHIKWLKRYLNNYNFPYFSLVVFNDRCTFKSIYISNHDYKLIYLSDLSPTITSLINTNKKILSVNEIDLLYKNLKSLCQITK